MSSTVLRADVDVAVDEHRSLPHCRWGCSRRRLPRWPKHRARLAPANAGLRSTVMKKFDHRMRSRSAAGVRPQAGRPRATRSCALARGVVGNQGAKTIVRPGAACARASAQASASERARSTLARPAAVSAAARRGPAGPKRAACDAGARGDGRGALEQLALLGRTRASAPPPRSSWPPAIRTTEPGGCSASPAAAFGGRGRERVADDGRAVDDAERARAAAPGPLQPRERLRRCRRARRRRAARSRRPAGPPPRRAPAAAPRPVRGRRLARRAGRSGARPRRLRPDRSPGRRACSAGRAPGASRPRARPRRGRRR